MGGALAQNLGFGGTCSVQVAVVLPVVAIFAVLACKAEVRRAKQWCVRDAASAIDGTGDKDEHATASEPLLLGAGASN